jgi:hypothetical protein
MIYRLQPGEHQTLIIDAKDIYSPEQIAVEKDEKYEFACDETQRWKDWFINSGPNGYPNLLARLWGLRVKSAKCFCLCGAYNVQDRDAFPIGSEIKSEKSGIKIISTANWNYSKKFNNLTNPVKQGFLICVNHSTE